MEATQKLKPSWWYVLRLIAFRPGMYVLSSVGILSFYLWPLLPGLFVRQIFDVLTKGAPIGQDARSTIWGLAAVFALTGFLGYTGSETTIRDCYHFDLKGNTFRDNRTGAQFGRIADCTVSGNTFAGNVEAALRLIGQPDVRLGDNTFESNVRDVVETE